MTRSGKDTQLITTIKILVPILIYITIHVSILHLQNHCVPHFRSQILLTDFSWVIIYHLSRGLSIWSDCTLYQVQGRTPYKWYDTAYLRTIHTIPTQPPTYQFTWLNRCWKHICTRLPRVVNLLVHTVPEQQTKQNESHLVRSIRLHRARSTRAMPPKLIHHIRRCALSAWAPGPQF